MHDAGGYRRRVDVGEGMTGAEAARGRLSDDLALVGSGDRAALARVYDRTSAKLFGIVLRVLHDREAAEDVLQEVYLKIWKRAASFDRDRASPITWMATIARNSAIDIRRARDRRAEDPDTLIQLASDDVASDEMIRGHDERMQLAACMGELEEHQRQFIRSAFFDGFTYAELAERATVPLGTMKSWIRRGLERLRRCIDGE
ncbi:sigma-70 family RNA polymerase sigma factor [Sphingomonas sp.]|uniref:sigma-70 family RNA polymerase sigma factor n=1 Tax=Sphingomonas sp. TaxID=28214 RepID=UPI002BA8DE51|nr:sigma-70 family RNA polymerase sigma factor [Sphingomonas sp.]HTG38303.1 sigma-70 family RNA polymerase sigma factor [Sphingomonas sp.]